MAAGLLPAVTGRIVRSGAIAFAGEAAALDPRQTLGDALAFWAKLDGREAPDVERGLESMGISGLAEVPVRMLSTGQRKRATLARIVAGGAQIWLLDEPGNGLDSAALARLATAMAAHREAGGIVLAATHQPLGLIDPLEIAL
jgi:heme exporter protein A